MKSNEEILADIDELTSDEELEEYLEQLWKDAKQEQVNRGRLAMHFKQESMSLQEIMDLLENDNLDEVEHK